MANADNGLDRYDYAREKLWQAVETLVGDRDIQTRLTSAAEIVLRLMPDKHLPSEHRAEFEDIKKRLEQLHADPPRSHLTSEEGLNLAGRILSLYTELRGGI